MLWLLGLVLEWLTVIGFILFLFTRGPKGRFARLRCALHGNHYWESIPDFRKVTDEDGDRVDVVIVTSCTRCKEVVSVSGTVRVVPIDDDDLPVIPSGEVRKDN